MRKSLVVISLGLFLGALGCDRPQSGGSAPAPQAAAPAGDSAPVARIGDEVVTEADLASAARTRVATIEAECADKVYAARSQALEELLQARLIAAAAGQEGITPEALVAREVDAKVSPPTDEEIRAAYDQTQAQGRQLPPYDSIRDRFAEFLRQQKAGAVRKEFLERLRAGRTLEVMLMPPLPPKIEVSSDGPSKGPADARVTIVEFSDFECPFCVKAEPTVTRLLGEYGDRVRFVYRDFPLPFHARAQKASEAALCAQDQGKYWEMHERLFASEGKIGVDDLKGHAVALGLDGDRFQKCLDSGEKAALVETSKAAGQKAGVSGTPAFFINGRMLQGAQPYERFKQVIDAELAEGRG